MDDILGDLIPSPPFIYKKLQEVLNDSNSSFKDITKVIDVDPGLTIRLLKIVNSPFYGLSSSVDSITHAINILGTEQLVDLVLATEVMNKFKGIPKKMIDMDAFWKHSIACGLVSKMIAREMEESNPARYYVAGILHDIGSLVLYKEVPTTARECLAQSTYLGKHLFQTETEMLGFNHADIGKELLNKWNLHERLVEAVGYHHNPMEAKVYPRFATIVHTADILVYPLKIGSSGESFVPPLGGQVLDHIGLKQNQLEKISHVIHDKVDEVAGIFN
jgi:putative nucleotidyltransferase with HDIG domain